jgi:hypothetical protein
MQVGGQFHASRAFMATERDLVPTRERDLKAGLDVAAMGMRKSMLKPEIEPQESN